MTHTYTINYNYDSYPTDFMVPYAVKYGQIPPVLQIDIIRPDGIDFRIYSSALPPSHTELRLKTNSAQGFSPLTA